MAGGMLGPIAAEAADQNEARWSADGKSILFLSMSNGTQSVKVVPAAGGPVKVLAKPDMGIASRAEWSPDSKSVSYTQGSPVSSEDLYLVAAEGGTPHRLTNSAPSQEVAAQLVTPEKVSWMNEGYSINAYLFKPK